MCFSLSLFFVWHDDISSRPQIYSKIIARQNYVELDEKREMQKQLSMYTWDMEKLKRWIPWFNAE